MEDEILNQILDLHEKNINTIQNDITKLKDAFESLQNSLSDTIFLIKTVDSDNKKKIAEIDTQLNRLNTILKKMRMT